MLIPLLGGLLAAKPSIGLACLRGATPSATATTVEINIVLSPFTRSLGAAREITSRSVPEWVRERSQMLA